MAATRAKGASKPGDAPTIETSPDKKVVVGAKPVATKPAATKAAGTSRAAARGSGAKRNGTGARAARLRSWADLSGG